MYLYPKNVRSGEELGDIDIAIRRPDMTQGVTEGLMVYIESGIAKVAGTKRPNTSTAPWIYLYDAGPAEDVAIEFDLEWVKHHDGKYRPITIGEPWIFRVHRGQLLAQKGETTTPLILDTGNITKVDAVRGWYNLQRPWEDHGVVVGYVKDGEVWAIQYSLKESGFKTWGTPYRLTNLSNVVELSLYRTNDYRVGVVATTASGEIFNTVSERNWAGAGAFSETLYVARATLSKVDLAYLEYTDVETEEEETLQVAANARHIWSLSTSDVLDVRDPYNDGQDIIVLHVSSYMEGLQNTSFTVEDSIGFRLVPSAVEIRGRRVQGYEVRLTVTGLSNMQGEVKVTYDGTSGTNALGYLFKPFEVTFTPVGLIPIPGPEVVEIVNEGNNSIKIVFDKPVTVPPNSAAAFTVIGQVPKYYGGPLIERTFSVVQASAVDGAVLLQLDEKEKFRNVVGEVLIIYDMGKGGIRADVPVVSFQKTFTPTGLVPKNNPINEETLHAEAQLAKVELLSIEYTDVTYVENETLAVGAQLKSVDLTDVGIIDP